MVGLYLWNQQTVPYQKKSRKQLSEMLWGKEGKSWEWRGERTGHHWLDSIYAEKDLGSW